MMEREFDYDREIRERVEEAREEGIKKAIEIYLELGIKGTAAIQRTVAKLMFLRKR